MGVVREWDIACPLAVGYNLVGSAYPVDQSPDDRDMDDNYFTGTTDPWTADQIEFWMSDGAPCGLEGYDSHFRVDTGDSTHWTTQENSSLATEDLIEMFKIQRGAFINSRLGNAKTKAGAWIWPVPWDADAP